MDRATEGARAADASGLFCGQGRPRSVTISDVAWSIAVLAALGSALLALLLARRMRRTVAASSDSIEAVSSDRPTLRVAPSAPAEASARSCPVCHSEYPAANRFCVRDGAPLADGRASGPFSPGMICPTCRRGYPSDTAFCPEDADELVPYGLFGTSSWTRPPVRLDGSKICPECGARHQAAHLFCGHDGAELVIVN